MNKMLELGLHYYGLKEISGTEDNPVIVRMFHDLGFDFIDDDETAWCSVSMCWLAMQTKYEHPNSMLARDWLGVGEIITVAEHGYGEPVVAVFWRVSPNSIYGHVGMPITERDGYIYTLGGNQNNEINITPYSKTRLLGFRKLKGL